MIGLWDTTGNEVVKALAAERRSAGGVASGMALTLIVVTDEKRVRDAEAAATVAAAAHPCRLLVVVRADVERNRDRLDAEIVVGGRLGPCEAVVMRMYGRLALHAESVVMPLLVPDVPVVTWWHGEPPTEIATDFLGVVADRRITDTAQAPDPLAALRLRAEDYAPGDTDLAWTRITPWRTLVAGAFDTTQAQVTEATIVAPPKDPTAALMSGWLSSRLGITPRWEATEEFPRMRQVQLRCANGDELTLTRDDSRATFRRTGQQDRTLPLVRRPLGDELAEELRRLDADQVYAEALGASAGLADLDRRPAQRVHIWKDPTTAERTRAGATAHAGPADN
ncbi:MULTISPECIES: glucose-6-phosphate dehydrogenase assembly protein OpcA [Micromonospora]|uniref:Glucose-6-phosphate dehydrogenase assembly protein OpcA n=1 Tax=Micromonospora yangpuensis TaxID=683228 RepID=A0A1C6UZ19_9ACTN|nr:glucose-6-phosphate dehydrogenase assembly protein OpcA [Micromonospora yangpuensis]GGL95367.1 glucose-6-phosphate dehydrogenase assembly protein OpcA [Micromonospora yangpuensis]SCL59094.1 glucose-6-phosphate dehydrogenase assembly protein OpcA [Micromonospora yangpuensis]